MVETAPADSPVLEVEDARIAYRSGAGEVEAVAGVSFSIGRGEAFGLVGESGCGKSSLAFAAVRHLAAGGRLSGGRILFMGRDMAGLSRRELASLRGRESAMVYQDPTSSLNPLMPVGRQLMEVILCHGGASRDEARARALAALREVGLAEAEAFSRRYPHQLSGGQQQRVVIAMALIGGPSLLILDEPTTGLDATVEAQVLDLVAELRRRRRLAVLHISHDLGTVARVADRVGVMYAGELVEEGPVQAVFDRPRHPYTRALLDCMPREGRDPRTRPLASIAGRAPSAGARAEGCAFAPRCPHVREDLCVDAPIAMTAVGAGRRVRCARAGDLELAASPPGRPAPPRDRAETVLAVKDLVKDYRGTGGRRSATVRALDGVELSAERGRTVAVVGESGSGKSTLAKVVAGLERASAGSVRLAGRDLARTPAQNRPREATRALQMIFQNPDGTLNPRHSIGFALRRAVRRLAATPAARADETVAGLLEAVRLPAELARRRPWQLSGGEKQRVAIARALAGAPHILVADEPTSALDVSVQAVILNLFADIQARRGTSLVVISHDLGVVRYLADHVAVMYRGRIVEDGPKDRVFAPPHHPYTETLLAAAFPAAAAAPAHPAPGADAADLQEASGVGCPFHRRCPRKLGDVCEREAPPAREPSPGHVIRCHIALEPDD